MKNIMQRPKVSIIVPVYNSEKYIELCLNSIINQTYENIEILAIDDGSNDQSLLICEQIAARDKRVLVYHQSNMGVGATRNEGIRQAQGEYIMFVDSDDTIDEEMISDSVSHMQQDIDLYVSGTKMESYCDGRMSDVVNYIGVENTYSVQSLLDAFNIEYPFLCIGGPCSKLFRKKILVENNCYFDEMMTVSEDTLFILSYLKHCNRVSFSDKCYYHYRREGSNSLWSRYTPELFKFQKFTYSEFMDYIYEIDCLEATKKRFINFYFDILLGCILNEYKRTKIDKVALNNVIMAVSDEVISKNRLGRMTVTGAKRTLMKRMLVMRLYWLVERGFDIWNLLKIIKKK